MAYPERHNEPGNKNHELDGLRRANRDDEQHWREKGWETFEGGRDRRVSQQTRVGRERRVSPQTARDPLAREDRPTIGADYTRSPHDPSLIRDEHGRVRDDCADVFRGYGEPNPEANYPHAFNADELQNPNLNPMMEYPRSTTATFRILAIVLGLVLFGLLVAALYWNFLAPVRRTPEGPNGKVEQKVQTTAGLQQFAAFVSRMNERR
jgi:hypothetical protein